MAASGEWGSAAAMVGEVGAVGGTPLPSTGGIDIPARRSSAAHDDWRWRGAGGDRSASEELSSDRFPPPDGRSVVIMRARTAWGHSALPDGVRRGGCRMAATTMALLVRVRMNPQWVEGSSAPWMLRIPTR